MSIRAKTALCALLGTFCLSTACTAVPFAGDLLAGFFTNQVTVVIQNETAYVAVPEIRTSDSRNSLEDIFDQERSVTHFGSNGALAPNETAQFTLACGNDLETIYFGGAAFKDGSNVPYGDVDRNRALRRDHDFECGDIINIRLSGSIFNFGADVSVEQSAAGSPWGVSGGEDDRRPPEPDEDDDIADFLDDLFN